MLTQSSACPQTQAAHAPVYIYACYTTGKRPLNLSWYGSPTPTGLLGEGQRADTGGSDWSSRNLRSAAHTTLAAVCCGCGWGRKGKRKLRAQWLTRPAAASALSGFSQRFSPDVVSSAMTLLGSPKCGQYVAIAGCNIRKLGQRQTCRVTNPD